MEDFPIRAASREIPLSSRFRRRSSRLRGGISGEDRVREHSRERGGMKNSDTLLVMGPSRQSDNNAWNRDCTLTQYAIKNLERAVLIALKTRE